MCDCGFRLGSSESLIMCVIDIGGVVYRRDVHHGS